MGLQAKRLYLRLDRGQIINNDPDMVQSAALQLDVGGRDLFATTICTCIKRKVAIVLPHMDRQPVIHRDPFPADVPVKKVDQHCRGARRIQHHDICVLQFSHDLYPFDSCANPFSFLKLT